MLSNRWRRAVCVESLEPRRLLAAHPHPTPPDLVGIFEGTADATSGVVTALVINVTSESKTGALRGTVTATTNGSSGEESFTGSVNPKGVFKLLGKARHLTLNIIGSATSDSIVGKFRFAVPHFSSHGTFSVSG